MMQSRMNQIETNAANVGIRFVVCTRVQSTPSNNATNFTAFSHTAPSTIGSQRNALPSSGFLISTSPLRSHNTISIRSASPVQNISTSAASAASARAPVRKSTGLLASSTSAAALIIPANPRPDDKNAGPIA